MRVNIWVTDLALGYRQLGVGEKGLSDRWLFGGGYR